MSKEKVEKVEPNLKHVGRHHKWNKAENKLEEVPRDAPEFIINGREKIDLPDADEQKKGFHLEPHHRAVVMDLFPSDFKQPPVKTTGE